MITEKIKVYLVDDDAVFLKSIEIQFLQNQHYDVKTFATGELCLAKLYELPDIIILDYHLDGIDKTAKNGLETLDEIKKINPDIQVIMLSSQDKIDVAIQCMHHKALDYVIKSETSFMRIQKIISTHLSLNKIQKELAWYMERL